MSEMKVEGEVSREEVSRPTVPSTAAVDRVISALAVSLDLRLDRSLISQTVQEGEFADPLALLLRAAQNAGIYLKESPYQSADETFTLVQQDYPVVFFFEDGRLLVLERANGRYVDASIVKEHIFRETLSQRRLESLIKEGGEVRMLIAKKELVCNSLSQQALHGDDSDDHAHVSPVRRLVGLLNLDRRDVMLVLLFAGVAGVLSLASPLVVESLVNVVSWGIYLQPLIVLAGLLLVFLGISGVLRVLQTFVVEIIQRRQFVRIVSDLSHRFPRANQPSLEAEFPRELANRVFDIMTIQKASATLLLDGVSIVLTTILGLFLLAFYHPFLLGFDIVLVATMVTFIWLLGRGGIRTAIEESKTKYKVAHWLQDVIAMPSVFKTGGGEAFAANRANQLTSDYISARKKQFGVVIRQVIFAVGLQAVASTALLGLGGWLVINGQLTLGQLVASELIVTVVVGAFAKAGKSLEKFYDMMAGLDKVGHLLDITPDPRFDLGDGIEGPVTVAWSALRFDRQGIHSHVDETAIEAGSRVAIVGDDPTGKSLLAKAIAGLHQPSGGRVQVAGFEASEVAIAAAGEVIGYACQPDIFHGTLRENVDLGRWSVDQKQVRKALERVGLQPLLRELSNGIDSKLQTGGFPLSPIQCLQVVLARALVASPGVLVVDGIIDQLDPETREQVWEAIAGPDAPWTLIVVTNRIDVAELCESQIAVRK
jgi:putative ABC transport system ATP-binding protein